VSRSAGKLDRPGRHRPGPGLTPALGIGHRRELREETRRRQAARGRVILAVTIAIPMLLGGLWLTIRPTGSAGVASLISGDQLQAGGAPSASDTADPPTDLASGSAVDPATGAGAPGTAPGGASSARGASSSAAGSSSSRPPAQTVDRRLTAAGVVDASTSDNSDDPTSDDPTSEDPSQLPTAEHSGSRRSDTTSSEAPSSSSSSSSSSSDPAQRDHHHHAPSTSSSAASTDPSTSSTDPSTSGSEPATSSTDPSTSTSSSGDDERPADPGTSSTTSN